MKGFRILLLSGAAALPQLAMAGNTSPQALGMVNAILTFCAEVDPRNAQSFQAEWKSLGGGSTLGHPAGGDSQKAFDMITAELRLVARPTVALNCAAGATEWNGKSTAKDRDRDGDDWKDKDRDRDDSKDKDRNHSKDKDAGSAKDGKDSSRDKLGKAADADRR
jgi:hypothetical protein